VEELVERPQPPGVADARGVEHERGEALVAVALGTPGLGADARPEAGFAHVLAGRHRHLRVDRAQGIRGRVEQAASGSGSQKGGSTQGRITGLVAPQLRPGRDSDPLGDQAANRCVGERLEPILHWSLVPVPVGY
jgi:hypothetical protein